MKSKKPSEQKSFLAKLAWGAVKRSKFVLLVWLGLFIFGLLSYATFLKKEGFPAINFPSAIISGRYLVNDHRQVDKNLTLPLIESLAAVDQINDYQATSQDNFFSLFITFEQDVIASEKVKEIKSIVAQADLPAEATIDIRDLDLSKIVNDGEYHFLLTTYAQADMKYEDFLARAQSLANKVSQLKEVSSAEAISDYENIFNQRTQKDEYRQTGITKFGISEEDLTFYPAINIGIIKDETSDDIKLSAAVKDLIEKLNSDKEFEDLGMVITVDIAESVNDQINDLSTNLLSGLIAVVVISLILISWRAALITALFLPIVIIVTMLALYLMGMSLNVISLFALVLALGLFVDDATIVIEAIDSLKKQPQKKAVILMALKKIGFASLAGTLTTILVFSPLLFASGVIGEFIRYLPLTIIIALCISFLVSILLMPIFARYIIMSRKQNYWLDKFKFLTPLESGAANFLAKLPLINKKSPLKGFFIGAAMMMVSWLAFLGTFHFASNLPLDIFPPPKDSNTIIVNVEFSPQTSIEQAESITDSIDAELKRVINNDVDFITYHKANEREALIIANLSHYKQREKTSLQFLNSLEPLKTRFSEANLRISQDQPGPPADDFPFNVRLYGSDEDLIKGAAKDIESFIASSEFEISNQKVVVNATLIKGQQISQRTSQGRYYTVLASFDKEELRSGALILLQNKLKENFNAQKLADYGLEDDALDFSAGADNENVSSFSSMLLGILIAVILTHILLTILFRSFWQPFLIALAIPFGLFGVFWGLTITGHVNSFFVTIGILGLIGITINNTILLVASANSLKKEGRDKYEAISLAIKDRFRPLVATSLTTICALLPLALSDPFWEPLALTLIFGVASSTALIIISFPYYYLLLEHGYDLRRHLFKQIRRRFKK